MRETCKIGNELSNNVLPSEMYPVKIPFQEIP